MLDAQSTGGYTSSVSIFCARQLQTAARPHRPMNGLMWCDLRCFYTWQLKSGETKAWS
ncbi:MAG: hypothetical protein RLZZ387_899 [Chloroflexota bacterium]|jgi:hypothetical protein